jgi:hypothetical protein
MLYRIEGRRRIDHSSFLIEDGSFILSTRRQIVESQKKRDRNRIAMGFLSVAAVAAAAHLLLLLLLLLLPSISSILSTRRRIVESQKKRDRNRIAMGFLSVAAVAHLLLLRCCCCCAVAAVAVAVAAVATVTVFSNRRHVRVRHAPWFENDEQGELKNKRADVRVFPLSNLREIP